MAAVDVQTAKLVASQEAEYKMTVGSLVSLLNQAAQWEL